MDSSPEIDDKIDETDHTTNDTNDDTSEPSSSLPPTTINLNPTNMITAEASFSEATSADIPVGATRSSVARILVKHGQIFRVQVDNEVKEVHGKIEFIFYPLSIYYVYDASFTLYLCDRITWRKEKKTN